MTTTPSAGLVAGRELYEAAHGAAACLIDVREELEGLEAGRALELAIARNVRAVGLAMAHWKSIDDDAPAER